MSHPPRPLDPAQMDLAIELAKQSRPSPNPRVGAVVVKDGTVVGQGYHQRIGMPHAEVIALAQAGELARGGDLYVTLEPCCHQGHTGPCVEAVFRAGVSRVAVGMVDPDSRVSGQGIERLRQAGLHVVVGMGEEGCRQLLAGYVTHRTLGRPLVTLKAAITLDGYLAAVTGDSKWISSAQSRTVAHQLRAEADAILVGIETVLRDDPELTVRHCPGEHPARVILDSSLRIPKSSKLLAQARLSPVWLFHTSRATEQTLVELRGIDGVELIECPLTLDGRVDINFVVYELGKRGILSLLVEGGGRVHGSFLQSNLTDQVALFVAPRILGSGKTWIDLPGIETIAGGYQLKDLSAQSIGPDLLLRGTLSK